MSSFTTDTPNTQVYPSPVLHNDGNRHLLKQCDIYSEAKVVCGNQSDSSCNWSITWLSTLPLELCQNAPCTLPHLEHAHMYIHAHTHTHTHHAFACMPVTNAGTLSLLHLLLYLQSHSTFIHSQPNTIIWKFVKLLPCSSKH